jgi:PrgI family protein
MRYQVPQFIEVEDKIFGPLTLKQFLYLAGGGGLCLIFYSLLPFYIFIGLSLPVIAFCLALAFYKINDRPFIVVIEHAFSYTLGTKLYLWKQRPAEESVASSPAAVIAPRALVPTLSASKLSDLAWSLNIKDRIKE